jgi:serine-type D-Ala-D-Ala carboxypeptidase/endopeptidase (penicillin-binding protein 4)
VKSLFCSRRKLFAFVLAAVLIGPGLVAAEKRPAAHASLLRRRIEAILRESEARHGFWGIVVASLPDGRILYARNADHLMQPASNMKLFTTAAALEKLGPGFVFRTTVETGAAPGAQGKVGNLILVGRGDPNISNRVLPYQYNSQSSAPADAVLRELAAQVKARGVREVAGDIVADDRYFLYEPFSHDWSVEDLPWGYGAPVTALAFNDNSLTLHVAPGAKANDRGKVWLDPVPDYYQLDNGLATSAAGTEKEIFVERLPGSMTLDVWGEIPLGSPEDKDTVAIENPPLLAGELFKRALEADGIAVRGKVRVLELSRLQAATTTNAFAPAPGRIVLAEHRSAPLAEDIKVILKVSQNLHAEMLLRTLAHEIGDFGSLTVGLDILRNFAWEVGIEPGEIYFADGSGLSREALVSPRAFVKLLVYMAHSPHFQDFYDSLPVAGKDGTLAERFVDSSAAGKIHAKTGSIEHVNTLSGYMDLPSGRRVAFSILADNHAVESSGALRTLDSIAQTIYDTLGGRRRRPIRAHRPK